MSRGYKKEASSTTVVHDGLALLVSSPSVCGDEPFMLATKLQSVPIVVDNKKYRAVQYAIQHFNPQIIF